MRVWATQAWPLFISEANLRPSMVVARSASSRTMAADLPPSSRLTRLSCSPQIEAMRAAGGGGAGEGDLVDARVAHEVLADLAAGGDHADTTPFGMPASSSSSAMRMASSGVSGDGLMTMVRARQQRRAPASTW